VARPGSNVGKHEAYTYTREGPGLSVTMPMIPGDYELVYVANGTPDTILATRAVTVTPVTASLSAPGEAKIGQTITVAWEGPDYRSDYIAISRVGDKGHETYTYTREGSPLTIEAPELPGTYELRYVANQDRTVLATQTLVVSQ
jgi:Ca-activated chloride channel family protein